MEPLWLDFPPGRLSKKSGSRRYKAGYKDRALSEDGFICKHCHAFVSTASFLSGVQNRNHCPYCLWSRHVDLYAAGDRLCACKSPMKPIGLTTKSTGKKYGSGRGELMLIHVCTECEHLSINRIAADDIPETVFSIFETAGNLDGAMQLRLDLEGIHLLRSTDQASVRAQLFGA